MKLKEQKLAFVLIIKIIKREIEKFAAKFARKNGELVVSNYSDGREI